MAADFSGAQLPAFHLDAKQVEALTDLFRVLDKNSDGFVDGEEFRRFGEALTGIEVTREEALEQLRRADADGDDHLSLGEWLAYGRFIARMPDFFPLIQRIKQGVLSIDDRTSLLSIAASASASASGVSASVGGGRTDGGAAGGGARSPDGRSWSPIRARADGGGGVGGGDR